MNLWQSIFRKLFPTSPRKATRSSSQLYLEPLESRDLPSTVYQLNNDGTLIDYQNGVPIWAAQHVASYGVVSSGPLNGALFELDSRGDIFRYFQGAWRVEEGTGHVGQLQVATDGTIFDLRDNGNLFQETSAGAWSLVDTGVTTTKLAIPTHDGKSANLLYYLTSDGGFWSWDHTKSAATAKSFIGDQFNSNLKDVSSFFISTAGEWVYQRTDGSIVVEDPNAKWGQGSNAGATDYALAADGSLWILRNGVVNQYWIKSNDWSMPTNTFADKFGHVVEMRMNPVGTAVYVSFDNDLNNNDWGNVNLRNTFWEITNSDFAASGNPPSNFQMFELDSNISDNSAINPPSATGQGAAFLVAPDGSIYELQLSGNLVKFLPGQYIFNTIDTKVAYFVLSPAGGVYAQQTNGNVEEIDNAYIAGEHIIDAKSVVTGSNSQGIAISPNGTLWLLESLNGSLMQYSYGNLIATVPQSIQFVVSQNGCLFELSSTFKDYSYCYGNPNGGWLNYNSNVGCIGIAADGTYLDCFNGYLEGYNKFYQLNQNAPNFHGGFTYYGKGGVEIFYIFNGWSASLVTNNGPKQTDV